jgi:exopolysaccharide biosynthesis polyprenyl glycosylphosphotransferase
MQKTKERIQYFMVLLLDTICIALSYFVAGILWDMLYKGVTFQRMLAELRGDVEIILLAYAVIAVFFNYSERFIVRGRLAELGSVIRSNIILGAVIAVIAFALHETSPIGRGISLTTILVNTVFMYCGHLLLKAYLLKVYKNRFSTNQMLLMTTEERAADILTSVVKGREWTKRITGVIIMDHDMTGKDICGVPVVASADNMFDYARKQIVDEVFISIPYDSGDNLHDIVMELENMGIRVNLSVEILNQFRDFQVELTTMGDIPVISFANNSYDYRQMALKRLMDIAGALVGIVITAISGIFIVPAIKLESKGPAIFKQKRVGKNGRFFYMYKYRSMYADAEQRKAELADKNEMNGLMFKMEDDPRITKVGKFIRKTSLDELPQFFNVLKGDMSLIGTRPPTVDEFKQYQSYHKRRLSAKPGITGLWQVSGRNDISDFDDVVKLDLEYIDNWSIGLDIKILLKTVGAVLAHTGE